MPSAAGISRLQPGAGPGGSGCFCGAETKRVLPAAPRGEGSKMQGEVGYFIVGVFFHYFLKQKDIHYKQTVDNVTPSPPSPGLRLSQISSRVLCALPGGAAPQLLLGRTLNFPG